MNMMEALKELKRGFTVSEWFLLFAGVATLAALPWLDGGGIVFWGAAKVSYLIGVGLYLFDK